MKMNVISAACFFGLISSGSVLRGSQIPPTEGDFFAKPQVVTLKVEIPQPGLEALRKDPKTYVKATIREGDKVYADVGVRFKGESAFAAMEKKPSLAVKFNEFDTAQTFHGYGKIFLNNPDKDPTYLCEALAGDVFRAAKVPAPKVNFAKVDLNGRDVGLYQIVQAVNRDFLSEYFKKTKGNLYEGVNSDVTERLERDSGSGPNEQGDLKALASAAKDGDPANRLKKLSALLDVEEFVSFAATEVLLGHTDGYVMKRNNYRIYHDPTTDRMAFIPHGVDHILSKPTAPIIPEWKGLLARALFENSEKQKQYRDRLSSLLGTAFKPETLSARIDELAGKVRPVVTRDAEAGKAFEAALAQLKDRIAQRARSVSEQLKQPRK